MEISTRLFLIALTFIILSIVTQKQWLFKLAFAMVIILVVIYGFQWLKGGDKFL